MFPKGVSESAGRAAKVCVYVNSLLLFLLGALEYYTKKNMGWEYTQEEYDKWQLAERGGAQGDYREGVS